MKTICELIIEYLDHLISLKYSKETTRKTRLTLNRFNKWLKEKYDVRKAENLRADHMKKWQAYLSTCLTDKGCPLKARTINFNIIKVRGFLKHLSLNGYIRSDLINAVSYVKEPTLLPTSVLTHSQARRLLSRIETDTPLGFRDRAMLELLYSTGIRSGELLNLNVDDVNFRDHTALVTGKGDKQRMVPIGKTALRYLESYVSAVRPYLLKDRSEKAMFLSIRGNRLEYTMFRRIVAASGKGLNLNIRVTPHTFRRSCTTELIRGGANVYHVKELLGHESLETLTPYTKLTIIDLKKTHRKCHPREREGD